MLLGQVVALCNYSGFRYGHMRFTVLRFAYIPGIFSMDRNSPLLALRNSYSKLPDAYPTPRRPTPRRHAVGIAASELCKQKAPQTWVGTRMVWWILGLFYRQRDVPSSSPSHVGLSVGHMWGAVASTVRIRTFNVGPRASPRVTKPGCGPTHS